jgi:hypothetical protein
LAVGFLLFWGAMILTKGLGIVGVFTDNVYNNIHIIIPLAKLHSEMSKNKPAQPQQPSHQRYSNTVCCIVDNCIFNR